MKGDGANDDKREADGDTASTYSEHSDSERDDEPLLPDDWEPDESEASFASVARLVARYHTSQRRRGPGRGRGTRGRDAQPSHPAGYGGGGRHPGGPSRPAPWIADGDEPRRGPDTEFLALVDKVQEVSKRTARAARTHSSALGCR